MKDETTTEVPESPAESADGDADSADIGTDPFSAFSQAMDGLESGVAEEIDTDTEPSQKEEEKIPAEDAQAEGAGEIPAQNKPLMDKAKKLGFSDEDVAAFGDSAEEVLSRVEDNVNRMAMQKGKDAPPQPPTEKTEEPELKESSAEESHPETEDLQKMIEESGFGKDDPEYGIFMAMAKMNQQLQGQLQEMKKDAVSREAMRQEYAQQNNENQQVGAFFESVKSKYGNVTEEKRQEIEGNARALMAGHKAMGRDMSLGDALAWTSRQVFADMENAQRMQKLAEKGKARESSIVSRPGVTTSPTSETKTEEEAYEEFDRKLREHGF